MNLIPYKWRALGLLWVTYFLLQGTRQIYGATLPQIRLDFGVTDVRMGVVASAFSLKIAFASLGLFYLLGAALTLVARTCFFKGDCVREN